MHVATVVARIVILELVVPSLQMSEVNALCLFVFVLLKYRHL